MIDRQTLERVGLLVLAAVSIAFFLVRTLEIRNAPLDGLPDGDAADVVALSERDDLNVVFVLIDTLRADRMSAYGYERETTPFLSELAGHGLRFDRHLAQSSWTKASMASMWAGVYPLKAGVTRFDDVLSEEAELPAEILSEAGYRTVGIYRNGWVNGYFGFDQGFDRYYRPMGRAIDPDLERLRPNELTHGGDEELIADAIEFLRIQGKRRPFFLYLHLMDLHEYTYDDQSALFGSAPSDIYDNSLRRTDWLVSELHRFVAGEGMLDKTIFVVLSDHGEAFGERGFEGHARTVFPETTHTPLIIGLPFQLDAGVVVDVPTTNLDVWPTLFELLGLGTTEEGDGHSRVDVVLDSMKGSASAGGEPVVEEARTDEFQFAHLDENWGRPDPERVPAISVTDGEIRYVSGSDPAGAHFEAILSSDDGYRSNQIDQYLAEADRLREAARSHLAIEAIFAPEELDLDEMQLDQLRALGYQLP